MVFDFIIPDLIHSLLPDLKTFNISSLFSGRMIISSASLKFPSETDFDFTILSEILLPTNLPAASASFQTNFLEAFFTASSLVLGSSIQKLFSIFVK